jgi:hypothetical protein
MHDSQLLSERPLLHFYTTKREKKKTQNLSTQDLEIEK